MSRSLDVVLLSPGLPHDGATLAQRSLGGSETAAIRVATALAARGHHVTVFSPCDRPSKHDGVQYIPAGNPANPQNPYEHFIAYASGTPHDVTVISRDVNIARFSANSSVRVLWCHDLSLKRMRAALFSCLWNIQALYVLSEFQKRQYREVNPAIPERMFFVTRNGVPLGQMAGLHASRRDRTKLIYGSRPERGLEQCLHVMDRLRARGSDLVLHVASYENTVPELQPLVDHLTQRMAQMPNVRLLGHLRQAEWWRHLAEARAWVYPGCVGDFAEISCIAAAEAMAVGTPAVALHKGALSETLGEGACILVGAEETSVPSAAADGKAMLPPHTGNVDVNSPAYLDAFTQSVLDVTTDDARWEQMHRTAVAWGQTRGWDGVAEQWEADWLQRLDAQRGSPERIQQYLQRMGDWEAAGVVA